MWRTVNQEHVLERKTIFGNLSWSSGAHRVNPEETHNSPLAFLAGGEGQVGLLFDCEAKEEKQLVLFKIPLPGSAVILSDVIQLSEGQQHEVCLAGITVEHQSASAGSPAPHFAAKPPGRCTHLCSLYR